MKDAAGVCAPAKSGLTFNRVQVGRHWPARRARGEGGAEDQWWWEERSWQEAALRRSPLLKTLSGRGWDSSYCKKVKVEVSLFTFNFCCVNCCNTSQLLLLTGSRLLKLLLTTKCISTRIFVCLFVFIQLSLAAKKQFQHHHEHKVWSRFWIWSSSKILKLEFG